MQERRRLPLFVLPTVLLPGSLLPLHVFEPRYRQMAARCLETDKRFGVLFHDPDRSGPFELIEGAVGCTAEILEFRPLPDGRSLMLTRGLHRYRVVDGIESEAGYAEALVDAYDDRGDGGADPERRGRTLELFEETLRALGSEETAEIDEAADLSFQVASTFQIDPAWSQHLLELQTEVSRLDEIDRVLRNVLDQPDE